MTTAQSLRVVALAALTGLAPKSTAIAAEIGEPGDPRGPSIRVTQRDVDASNKKVAMAYGALADMWSKEFSQIGARFHTPRILRYDGGGFTACGYIGPDNAVYCPRDNTVYYDEVFVAAMQKAAASEVGTDGDMAAVGIIAHEVGHAVAMQLGHLSRNSYQNESTADCLAGAFTNQSQKDGSLEDGDVDEAFFGMSMAGDPTPRSTGDERLDARSQARLARNSHGTKGQRMRNFRVGLEGGAGRCLAEFR